MGSINIFVDPFPVKKNLDIYTESISKYFRDKHNLNVKIHVTCGLADGYIKSTFLCETEYIFQLEHDWVFLPNIKHSLESILGCMKLQGMEHLRFSKRKNEDRPNGKETFTEIIVNDIPFCRNNQYRSNNPHIINRSEYLKKWNNRIDTSKPHSAYGIEHKLRTAIGYVYGPLNHGPTIRHLDGKK